MVYLSSLIVSNTFLPLYNPILLWLGESKTLIDAHNGGIT